MFHDSVCVSNLPNKNNISEKNDFFMKFVLSWEQLSGSGECELLFKVQGHRVLQKITEALNAALTIIWILLIHNKGARFHG